ERRSGVAQTGGRFAIDSNIFEEFGKFQGPRLVAARILPRRRFRRTHFREHLVERQTLEAVRSAEALDVKLGAAAVNLEREQVLPLRAADVKESRLLTRCAQEQEGVVIDWHVPEVRVGEA